MNTVYLHIGNFVGAVSEGYQGLMNSLFISSGYTHNSRATAYDFLLSIIPRNLWHLGLLVLGCSGYFEFYQDLPFLRLFGYLNSFSIAAAFSVGYLALFALSTLSLLFSFLRADLIFKTQIAAGSIGVILQFASLLVRDQNLIIHIPKLLWAFTFFLAMIFANAKYWSMFFPMNVSRRMRTRFFPERAPDRYRILFIEPALKKDRVAMTQRRQMYPFTTPYLAALLPSNWDPMIIDVLYDMIDYDIDTDIVAITAMSLNFSHVQEIAKEFRKRGKIVIFGGADPSRQPEKYLEFCDSVLVGAAEGYFSVLLKDWEAGQLKPKYVNLQVFDLKNMPLPRYDLLPLRRYANAHNILLSTSCPYHCSFCQYNRTRESRLRPVADVVRAIQATPAKFFWFEAPELLVYKKYIRELNGALGGMKIHWASHATMKSCEDLETLKQAYSAGLRQIWIGVESFSKSTLQLFNKKMNIVSEYQKIFSLLNKVGISVYVHLIFGSATDVPEDFKETIQGVIKGKVAAIIVHNMSIFAGDEAFEKTLQSQGAVEFDGLKQYDTRHRYGVTFYRSTNFTDAEMMQQLNDFHTQFYSLPSIFRRICMRSPRNFSNFLPDLNENIFYSLMRRSHSGYSQNFYQRFAEFVDDSVENVTLSFAKKPEETHKNI